MTRILIVAAYASVRAGLHALLADADDFTLVGAAGGSAEMEAFLPECGPDLVLWDANSDDAEAVLNLASAHQLGLVALADDADDALRLRDAGLPGWALLGKEAEGTEIVGAIRAVAVGLLVLDPAFASLLASTPPPSRTLLNLTDALPGETLTAREREVLQLLALGLPNKTIAARLSISLHTVKFHVASILARLGASSRTEAVAIGAQRGYVSL